MDMRYFIKALPILLLLSFSFVSFGFHFDHLVLFRVALGCFSIAGLYMLYKLKNNELIFMVYLYSSWAVLAALAAIEEALFSSFFFGGLVMAMGYLSYMLIYLSMKKDGQTRALS